jgi:hypothetical protein
MLSLGSYRVRIVSGECGFNPGKRRETYKVSMQVIDVREGDTPAGSVCTALFMDSVAGLSELKRMVMHAAGFGPTLAQRSAGDVRDTLTAAESAYDALDAQRYSGSIVEASLGVSSGAPSVAGRLVDVIVSRGKEAAPGDYYRVYTWGVVEAQP